VHLGDEFRREEEMLSDCSASSAAALTAGIEAQIEHQAGKMRENRMPIIVTQGARRRSREPLCDAGNNRSNEIGREADLREQVDSGEVLLNGVLCHHRLRLKAIEKKTSKKRGK
jgi:hypothetical protein